MKTEHEIRLAKIYDNYPNQQIKVEFLDFLTTAQFRDFKISLSEIEELHNIRRLMDFVEINDKEMIRYLNLSSHELISKAESWNGIKRQDANDVFLNSNRLLLNYLSSIRTFLDHSETFLNRKFGDNSVQLFEFKRVVSFFYDNSFAYRFFYKLRNYAQHIGLPLHNFKYSTKYDRTHNRIEGTLSLTFNRDKLISSYERWGNVKEDLKKMNPEFEVTPLIFEMTHNINQIKRNVVLIQKDELCKAASFITELIKHLQTDNGEIFIAYNFEMKDNGEISNYESIYIPFETIEFIQKIIGTID